MTSPGMGNQLVSKKGLVEERFESVLNKYRAKRNSRVLTQKGLLTLTAEESGVPVQVSSTSLDHGSKLRGPSPKALVQLNSVTLIFPHFGDGSRIRTGNPSPNYHTKLTRRRFSTDLACIVPLHGGSLVVLDSNVSQGQPRSNALTTLLLRAPIRHVAKALIPGFEENEEYWKPII
ncbi:hypothetical protein TNCV_4911601 [Trichonephila clavipes]|nr:hypothetical protein TNCV_4911601 [Trichonephila clavipes]